MAKPVRVLRVVGVGLLVASLFFLWQSSYESFYLTAAHGPQMLFFSAVHTWPGWLISLFFASWFAYYGFFLFAVVVSCLGFLAAFQPHATFIKVVRLALLFVGLHFAVFHTYDFWSGPLFGS